VKPSLRGIRFPVLASVFVLFWKQRPGEPALVFPFSDRGFEFSLLEMHGSGARESELPYHEPDLLREFGEEGECLVLSFGSV
jgi:hypothetical protein